MLKRLENFLNSLTFYVRVLLFVLLFVVTFGAELRGGGAVGANAFLLFEFPAFLLSTPTGQTS